MSIFKIGSEPLKKHYIFLIVFSMALSFYTATMAHMNNWLIFKSSFLHLFEGTSLYIHYPTQHDDLFKYSPTFALLMAPLTYLPSALGAVLWNLSGALLFITLLIQIPLRDSAKKAIFWISLPEFIGSTQGFQSNIHIVALLGLFWMGLEKKKAFMAALCILLSFYIKIFGVIALSVFIFSEYSFKNKFFLFKFIVSFLGLTLILTLLPLPITGWDGLSFQYSEWLRMLKTDVTQTYGFSLMGIIHSITGQPLNHLAFQAGGGITLLTVFFLSRDKGQSSRLLAFVSVLYFLILFNHRSESSTFIIAMMAFGIHQSFIMDKRLRWLLIVMTLGCVSLMYSDLFRHIRKSHLDFYAVKAWPFIVLWPLALWQTAKNTWGQSLTSK